MIDYSKILNRSVTEIKPSGIRKFFDIAEQMKNQPRGGVLLINGIEVEMSEVSSGGGFDVDVEDWGDVVEIPLPLNI